jgi:diguanylate cyclase (GGDEF)-like protein
MPEMNGDKVLQVIKQNERLKEIPVLVISSSSDMDNVVKCIRLGADDYLPMPVNNTLLHARINSCLVKKVARDREQKTLSELNRSRQRLSTAIENIDEGFAVFDADDVLLTYNTCFKELYPGLKSLGGLGITYEELIRENIRLGVYQVERREICPNENVCLNEKEIEDWVSVKVGRHQNPTLPHVDLLSTGVWVEVIENKIPEGGTVSIHKDVSEGKKKEKHLEYLALHDGLTGLANRKKFDDTLKESFEKAKESKTIFGVAFFDLDSFKAVNDTLGHDFGDFLLKTVSAKLVESVRESDLVARFGGDEFAALVTNISSEEDMVRVAERCLESIGTKVEKDGQVADFGVSIGLALYPASGKSPDELLKKADAAMYEAKKAGKGTYRIAG